MELVEPDQRSDGVTALRRFDDQTLGLDTGQGLTDRGGGDPQGARQVVDIEPCSRGERMVDQHVHDDVCDVIGEGASLGQPASGLA